MNTKKSWVLVSLLGINACAWWTAGRRLVAVVAQEDQIQLNHRLHTELGMACEDCHGAVATASSLAQLPQPSERKCLECHERENCASCHSDVDRRSDAKRDSVELLPRGDLAFSHRLHASHTQECRPCHADIHDAAKLPLPKMQMAPCLTCHQHQQEFAQAQCDHCHRSLREFPLEAVGSMQHQGDWLSDHGLLAQSKATQCLQCHPQQSCSECHSRLAPEVPARLFPERVQSLQLHRADFASSHGIEARADGSLCMRCHSFNAGDFCGDCHQRQNLTPTGRNPRNPHPSGYAIPGNGSFHGTDARLHIETCVACHDQGGASNCVGLSRGRCFWRKSTSPRMEQQTQLE